MWLVSILGGSVTYLDDLLTPADKSVNIGYYTATLSCGPSKCTKSKGTVGTALQTPGNLKTRVADRLKVWKVRPP